MIDPSINITTTSKLTQVLGLHSTHPIRSKIDRANEAFSSNRWKEAFELYKEVEKVAHSGHVYYRLANLYLDGHGTPKSQKMSAKYFKVALKYLQDDAVSGDPEAQCDLGYCYDNGYGIEENKELGVQWYLQSAEQGYARAQNNVGCMYSAGDGVKEDKKKAVEYYRLAAEQNYAGAQHNLGYMYDHGMGVAQDKELAVKYYKLAADQNYPRAQYNLGVMYSNGDGVAVDKATAIKYYQLAADAGYSGAQCNLGYLYHCGDGVQSDWNVAFKYYTLAAEQNDPGALFYLGYMYEHGQSVPKNPKLTVRYYVEAKTKGDTNAKNFLSHLLNGNLGTEYKTYLYEYFFEEWPMTFIMLQKPLQRIILETAATLKQLSCMWAITSKSLLPNELINEICRWMVIFWKPYDRLEEEVKDSNNIDTNKNEAGG